MSINHDGVGRLIGWPSKPDDHAKTCDYRNNGGKAFTCNCPAGAWDDGYPTAPSKLDAAIKAARTVASAGDNIAYPSRAAAWHVRRVISDLIEAVEERCGRSQ